MNDDERRMARELGIDTDDEDLDHNIKFPENTLFKKLSITPSKK